MTHNLVGEQPANKVLENYYLKTEQKVINNYLSKEAAE